MRLSLASWNVNGLRACVTKGFMDFVKQNDFDIIGVQETKMLPEQANFDFTEAGYRAYWHSAEKKGYSGTLTLSKEEPLEVIRGMDFKEADAEGRVLTLGFRDFYFVNVYAPNAKSELERLDYRIEWQDAFCAHLNNLKSKKPVIVCGDLNVAHNEIDLKHPKRNTESAGFTPREREKMTELLASGFADTFRLLYPDKKDAYTWWSFIGNTRERNVGWRIDYFLVSPELEQGVKDALIYDWVYGSDHCPVGLELEI